MAAATGRRKQGRTSRRCVYDGFCARNDGLYATNDENFVLKLMCFVLKLMDSVLDWLGVGG